MSAYVNPTVTDFKMWFVRDFPYGTDINTSITDTDIFNAQTKATYQINQALYSDQGSYSIGFNLLSAHLLVISIRGSSQGINGQFNFLQNSKGAGPVSESFSIPPDIANDPVLSVYTKTNYGCEYLMEILPKMRGQMFTVPGHTKP